MFRVVIWVESFRCAGILLLQWQGENFGHRQTFEILPTFNLYTVPAKILYLQKCSTDFRNLCLGSKMFRVGIWVESFRGAGILLLQWKARWKFCASTTFEILPLSTCTLCQQKSYISNGIQTDFRNLCLGSKMLRVVHFGGKFQLRRCFNFAMARWKLWASTTFEILPTFNLVHCASKNPISPKVFNGFSKSLPQLEDV